MIIVGDGLEFFLLGFGLNDSMNILVVENKKEKDLSGRCLPEECRTFEACENIWKNFLV
jgi:hypothetical protein